MAIRYAFGRSQSAGRQFVTAHSIKRSGFEVYKRLLGYASHYWFAFVLGMLGTIAISGIDASFTWSLKPILDKGFIARDQHFIQWLPLFIICAISARGVATYLSNYYMTWAARKIVMRFRQQLFEQFLYLPATFFDNTTSGQLLSAVIYNVEQVAKASTDSIVTIVQESCFIVGLISVMFINSVKLTLLFMVVLPMIAGIARISSKRMRRLSHSVQQSMGQVTHVLEEGIEGYKVIRTFGGLDYEVAKFDKLTEDNCRREVKIIATNSLATSGVQLVAAVAIALTIFLATGKNSTITAGGFTSVVAAMLALLKPLKNLTTVSSTIQKGIAGAESIFNLLDEPREKDTGTQKIDRVKGAIEFKNVHFAYKTNNKAVLDNINFTVEPGKTIALVGRSGGGKTTLVNLLPRFYDNYEGRILIDGIDIRDLRLADLRKQFALVSQHVMLFNDTIAKNIAYGSFENISEDKIVAAAEAANAMEFIRALPEGLNSRIGENGVLLSGGQRQRIAIARALLKNAPILILDEATSSLDTESERSIQAALEKLIRNRTTLVIAHRLSTIENADTIMVLDQGKIVEKGTHAELLALEGHYAKLHRMQFKE